MSSSAVPRVVSPHLGEPSEAEFADLASRAAAFHRTRDPRDLWPGVDPSAIQSAADDLGRAVRAILADIPATLVTGPRDAEAMGIAAHIAGVGPLLGHWLEVGQLQADDAVHAVLVNHLRHSRKRSEDVRAHIVALATDLASTGVTLGVLKGFHTARVYYPEPAARPFSDVDLVVQPDEIDRTRRVLRAHGWVEGAGGDQPYKREWRLGDRDSRVRSFHLWHARNPWIIELATGVIFGHVTGESARRLEAAVLEESWTTEEGTYRVPSRSSLFAMVAVHASGELYSSRLLRLIELVLIARPDAHGQAVDWDAVLAFLTQTNTLKYAYPALHLAEQLVPDTIPSSLLRAAGATRTKRGDTVLAEMTPTSPILRPGATIMETLMWAGDWREITRRFWRIIRADSALPLRSILTNYHWRIRRNLFSSRFWTSWIRGDGINGPE